MLFLVRRCGELVSFSRFMYCLHSSLGRMGESGSQSGVQLVTGGGTYYMHYFLFDIGNSKNGLLMFIVFCMQMIVLLCCGKFPASVHF